MGRKKSGIVSIRLNTPTIHGAVLEPAPVNFFYGKNGVGKTSIGRALADPTGDISWKEGKPLKVVLFNEEYVERALKSVNGFPGVYALSRENAEIQRKIEDSTRQKEEMATRLKDLEAELDTRQRQAEELHERRIRAIWQATAEIRKRYPAAVTWDEPEALASGLLASGACAYSRETMDAAYEMAYGSAATDAEPYQLLYAASFPTCPLMDIPLVSHADAGLARVYRAAGSFEWAVHGHDAYLREGRCPFCDRELPEFFEERFRECMDTKYHRDMEKLKAFAAGYAEAAGKARETLVRNLGNPFSSTAYRVKAARLMERLESNRILIQQKIDNPRLEIRLEEVGDSIRELNEIREEVNRKIDRLIRAARDLPEARKRCEKIIRESMTSTIQGLLEVHASEERREAEALQSQELQRKTLEGKLRLLDRETEDLRAAMTDISGTMEKINRSLADNDFTGFRFSKRDDNTYEIVRGNSPATGLSEGERKFVAFLYFYHTVLGSLRADAASEDQVIVVDDPATSSDSEVMSLFSVMIKEIAQQCRARFLEGVETGECPDTHIHQLFFFTHNKVFFQMVANDSVSDNECSLFYEVRKNRQNESTVIPCLVKSGVAGGDSVNRTPVIGDYQEMWMEYRKTEDPRTLLRLSRAILARYFLDTCHYSGTDIRQCLLERNREAFMPEGLSGFESGFSIVSAMVALMGMDPLESMDSVYFDVRAVSADQIRFVFRRIFEVLKQEQHYAYMIRI